jgi:hypothetical protein
LHFNTSIKVNKIKKHMCTRFFPFQVGSCVFLLSIIMFELFEFEFVTWETNVCYFGLICPILRCKGYKISNNIFRVCFKRHFFGWSDDQGRWKLIGWENDSMLFEKDDKVGLRHVFSKIALDRLCFGFSYVLLSLSNDWILLLLLAFLSYLSF